MNVLLDNMVMHLRFLLDLLLGVLPFFLPLTRRKHVWLRLISGLLCLCALSIISLPFGAELFLYTLGAAGLVWLCCDVTPQDALYCAACGYAWQHFCYALREALRLAAGIPDSADMAPAWSAVSAAIILVGIIPAYFLFARQMAEKKRYNVDTHHSLTSTIIVLIIVWVFSIAASTAFEGRHGAAVHRVQSVRHVLLLLPAVDSGQPDPPLPAGAAAHLPAGAAGPAAGAVRADPGKHRPHQPQVPRPEAPDGRPAYHCPRGAAESLPGRGGALHPHLRLHP